MKRGTPDHPKTLRFRSLLKVPVPHAVGLLEMLWHWTAKYAPAGDIGHWSNEDIEQGLCWEGESGALIAALVSSGLLDEDDEHRLLVHDWHDHADQAVKKSLQRKENPAPGACPHGFLGPCPDRVRTPSGPPEPEPVASTPPPTPPGGVPDASPAAEAVWGPIRQELREHVPPNEWARWVRPTIGLSLNGDLEVWTPSKAHRGWIPGRARDVPAIRDLLAGAGVAVRFVGGGGP